MNQIEELKQITENYSYDKAIAEKFKERLKEGMLSKKENEKSHICVYFAAYAYDLDAKQVLIGHHKKSGLWLFNGGHSGKGETTKETIKREIAEEWGLDGNDFEIKPTEFLSITPINNPTKQPCTSHYDLWCFIEVNRNNFNPKEENLLTEFYEYGWKTLDEARNLTMEPTLSAIDFIEEKYFNFK